MSSQIDLTFYNHLTGEITINYSGQNPEGQKASLSEYSWIEGTYDSTEYYILSGTPIIRPGQITTVDKTTLLADGFDTITIQNAPSGAILTARNLTTGSVASGTITNPDTFSSNEAGTILLKVESFPYLPFEVTVYAS